jgi:O-antigen/teichoic acid export membrane protein
MFVQNVLTTLSARVVLVGMSLLSAVILARVLGPEGRGLLALVFVLPELLRSFALFGLEQANAVYAGLEPSGRRVLVWQSLAVAAAVGGIATLGGIAYLLLGAPGFDGLVRGPLWMYLLSLAMVPGMLLAEYWYAILRGMNQIFVLNVIDVGSKVVSLLAVVALVGFLGMGVAGAVWADTSIKLVMIVTMVVLLRRAGVWGKPVFDPVMWKRTSRFSLLAYSGTLAAYLNYRVDEIFIAMFLRPADLGFYVIAVGLAERLWILTGAVANVLLPHLTNNRDRDPTLSAVIARHVLIWTGLACLAIFVLAEVIVRVLFSSEFLPAVSALRWLLPGILVLSVGKVLVAELHAKEKVHYAAWTSAAAALINIVLNVILVPRMGISGAALASTVSYSILSCMVTWYYLREVGASWTLLVPRRSDLELYATLWRRFRPAAGKGASRG